MDFDWATPSKRIKKSPSSSTSSQIKSSKHFIEMNEIPPTSSTTSTPTSTATATATTTTTTIISSM